MGFRLDITSLEKMITAGRDSAMLRLSLARALVQEDRVSEAVKHLEAAVEMNPDYTAAWKELGRQYLADKRSEAARKAWEQGLKVADENGDKQAGKEMTVFLRRLEKRSSPPRT
jgi:predicted negative regulator of RcsB-dependent stress response